MEKEKYRFDDEGNLIFNEIGDDEDDKKMMPPQHLDYPPLSPSTLPAVPAYQNRTRGSSATRHAEKMALDAKFQNVEKLDASAVTT